MRNNKKQNNEKIVQTSSNSHGIFSVKKNDEYNLSNNKKPSYRNCVIGKNYEAYVSDKVVEDLLRKSEQGRDQFHDSKRPLFGRGVSKY